MIRVGIGYDIHRLVEGRRLVLGGLVVPHDKGLIAHSDGDVVCHAIADALLGAAGLPNIGALFPDTDDKYKDADSLLLLAQVKTLITETGYAPAQIDVNIIAQRPKLQGYVADMAQRIAECLCLDIQCISIKPRTNEHLGPEGREEAISAQAMVTIQRITVNE